MGKISLFKKEHSQIDYFCILAGGGVRGTSYVGVFKALEELNVNLKGIAGSSVGAIFAAFFAVGYKHQEMHDAIFDFNFETIRDIYVPFGKDFGICKGDNILNWVKAILERKFYGENYRENHNKPIRFKDVDTDLIIVATDVSSSSIKEFSRFTTPDMEIAQALRASISIPGFFRPVWEGDSCFVDGDITKNLPLWINSKIITSKYNRILEFRLEADSGTRRISNPIEFFNSVIDTASNVSTEFIINLYGDNDQFDFVNINTGDTKIIDFSIPDSRKEELVDIGYNTTMETFSTNILTKRRGLIDDYEKLLKYVKRIKKFISKNQINKAQMELALLANILVQNKNINNHIEQNIKELLSDFTTNLTCSIVLRQPGLKNPKDILLKINKCIDSLQGRIDESKSFIDNITNLKLGTVVQ